MEVVLPKWGVTMQEATLTTWRVAEGDSVEQGQALAEVETDKIDAELRPRPRASSKSCWSSPAPSSPSAPWSR